MKSGLRAPLYRLIGMSRRTPRSSIRLGSASTPDARSHARSLAVRAAIAVCAATLTSSCLGPGTTQSLRYYTLSPVAADQSNGGEKRMGIMPVRLPGYLDRPALVERRGVEIHLRPFSAWAAPLDQEFSRVLAENLQRAHPGSEIAVFPWRRSFIPDQRLDVDVVRFEVENRAALLHARWRLVGANGNGVGAAAESRIEVPLSGDDDNARVAALSAALGRLSAEVARAINR